MGLMVHCRHGSDAIYQVGSSQSTHTSESFPAISGIPQGSHLGPLVFLLYFNDVFTLLEGPSLAFADDLYYSIKGVIDASFLQHQLTTFSSWCKTNCLTLNINKCGVITFTRSRHPVITNYILDGHPVACVDQMKDLGVVLDARLSYSLHTSYVVDKASINLGTSRFSNVRKACTVHWFALN